MPDGNERCFGFGLVTHDNIEAELELWAQRESEPPEPPGLKRRLVLPWPQRIGLAIFGAFVVIAMLGFFDPMETVIERSTPEFDAYARFSARLRDHHPMLLEIVVRNRSDRSRDFRVELPRDYLEGFDAVDVRPNPSSGYELYLPDVPPGGEQRIVVQGAAMDPFMRRGEIVVSADDERATLPVETFVYP